MNHTSLKYAITVTLLLLTGVVNAADLLIKNANIVGAEQADSVELKDILVRGDRIDAIGAGLDAPDGFRVIDAAGKPVTTGLFNADTQIGLREVSAAEGSVDASTLSPYVTASLRVADAYNPSSTVVAYNRMLGITHSLIQPSNGIGLFAGTAAVVKLTDDDGVLVEKAAMVVSLGNPGSLLAGESKAAAMAMLREAIEDARDFSAN